MTQETLPPADATPTKPTGIAGLRRMSTTAGVGIQEYRAVNTLAVAGVVCGASSWLGLLHPLLLSVALAAVVLGSAGVVQVRRSRGTQGGLMLAVAGVVLGVGIGGAVLVRDAAAAGADRANRAAIEQTAVRFGDALAADDYRAAYDLTTGSFQDENSFEAFRDFLSSIPTLPDASGRPLYGPWTGARSNGLAEVTRDASTGDLYAEALLIVSVKSADPFRQPVRLARGRDGWRIRQFGTWFPPKRGPPAGRSKN